MDWNYILNFFSETAYLLIVLSVFIAFSIFKGRQAIINVIVGLYLALLISIEFPSYDQIFSSLETPQSVAGAKLIFFTVISILTTMLFSRIMPDEFRENKFESLGKKFILAASATILVMIFSFHVLPVTEFLMPGTPIQSLFAAENFFFWWLISPLVVLFFHK